MPAHCLSGVLQSWGDGIAVLGWGVVLTRLELGWIGMLHDVGFECCAVLCGGGVGWGRCAWANQMPYGDFEEDAPWLCRVQASSPSIFCKKANLESS